MHKLVTHTPAADVPADVKKRAAAWEIWASETNKDKLEPDGSCTFAFDYSDNYQERILVQSGRATLTPDDGSEKIVISPGDYVIFHRGFSCTWHVHEPMRKRFCYFDENGNECLPNNISCDLCGLDCWNESFLVMPGELDLCPECFNAKGADYESAVYLEEGKEMGEAAIPTKKLSRAERASKRKVEREEPDYSDNSFSSDEDSPKAKKGKKKGKAGFR